MMDYMVIRVVLLLCSVSCSQELKHKPDMYHLKTSPREQLQLIFSQSLQRYFYLPNIVSLDNRNYTHFCPCSEPPC